MSYRVDYYRSPIRFLWSQDWRIEPFREGAQLCKQETITPVVLRLLPREGLVLEAGCGSGRWVAFLKEHGARIVGMDFSDEGLRLLKSEIPGVPVAVGLVETMPFRNGAFGAVFSHGVVEHIEDGPHAAIAEARRVLADNGILILAVPYNNLFRRLFVNWLHSARRVLRTTRGAQLAFCEYRFSIREINEILNKTGFQLLDTCPADLNPPRNMGLYVDAVDLFGYEPISAGGTGKGSFLFHLIVSRDRMWELSRSGRMVARLFRRLSPWFACGMVLFTARACSKNHNGSGLR